MTAPFNVGGDVTVAVSMTTNNLYGRNRGELVNGTGINDLVDDLIFNNLGGDMTLTLTGLPAGDYQFVGYFNDSFYNETNGSPGLSGWGVNLYVGPNDGTPDATAVVSDYRDTNPNDPVETATLALTSNGVDPVVLVLQGTTEHATNPYRFAFNGFTVTAAAAIPEPASAGLMTLIAAAACRRRR